MDPKNDRIFSEVWNIPRFPCLCWWNPRYKSNSVAYFLGLAIWVALCSLLNELVMCCLSFHLPLSLSEVSDKPSETGGTLIIKAWRASYRPHHVAVGLSLIWWVADIWQNSGLLSSTQAAEALSHLLMAERISSQATRTRWECVVKVVCEDDCI